MAMAMGSLGSLTKLWQACRGHSLTALPQTGESSDHGDAHIALVMSLRQARDRRGHAIRSSRFGVAAGVAAGGAAAAERVDELLVKAKGSFRWVSMDRVSEEAFLPGGAVGTEITEVAKLGEVDAFISHSWNDPPSVKWQVLQAWRRDFKAVHGREPRVWIDKYCIDQDRVAENLELLPIFLAGCVKLVVLAGPTYHQRLWCLAELFTFISVGGQEGEVTLLPLPGGPVDWGAVDVRKATCGNPADCKRLLAMMEVETGAVKLTQGMKSLAGQLDSLEELPSVRSSHAGGPALAASWRSPGSSDAEGPFGITKGQHSVALRMSL